MSLFNTTYEEKLWYGPKVPPIYGSNESLGQILITSMARNRLRIAQICHDTGVFWTNEDLLQLTIRCALNLLDLGLKEGDVIGVASKNEMILTPIVVAALLLGLPINAVKFSYKREDILHMFSITEPKVVICCPENVQVIQSVIEEIGGNALVYTIGDRVERKDQRSAEELLKFNTADEKLFVPPSISDASKLAAVICCSSGTTGPAKGVAVSHNLLAYQSTGFGLKYGGVYFSFSTLDWLTGTISLTTCLLNGVTRVITTQLFTPNLMVEIIKRHQVNGVLSSPSHLAFVARYEGIREGDLDSMREWMVGGSLVSKTFCEELNRHMKNGRVQIVYGTSEVGGLVSRTTDLGNYDSAGKLGQGIMLKIVDEEGCALGVNERGEVCLRCIVPMSGYYKDEVAAQSSFSADSWWQSGDVGYVDESGFLHLVDRKKDIIKYMGHQVDPSEIECLIQTLPGVALVAVIGIHDPIKVDLPTAVILKTKHSAVDEDTVTQLVERSLSQHKWLRGGVHFVDTMPLSSSGKILKRELKRQLESQFCEDR